ncbi:MAG: hypothetical protein H7340_11440 [Variovorax sp.]|nr:hypothetical protein [Variovorax sp.]
MTAKQLFYRADARDKIRCAVYVMKKEREAPTSHYEREPLEDYIAKLSFGVALIKVGVATETALKARKLRVDAALHTPRAAVGRGSVSGAWAARLRPRDALLPSRCAS